MRSYTRSFVFFVSAVLCLMLTAPAFAGDHGQPLWFDLVTEDTKAATAFYEGLFGWEIGHSRGEVIQIFHNGRNIAGLVEISNSLPSFISRSANSRWSGIFSTMLWVAERRAAA